MTTSHDLVLSGITNATDITTEVKSTLFRQDGSPPYPNSMLRTPYQSLERESNDNEVIHIDSQSAATIRCEFTAYANRKIEDGQWTDKTRLESESILDTFVEITGNKPISLLNKMDVERYASVVSHLPPNRKKKSEFKSLSAQDASDKNKANGGTVLSPRQQKKYFTTISPIFNEFVQEGLLEFNYFHRYRGKIRGAQQNIYARSPFTIDDLHIMFESEKAINLLASPLTRTSRAWGYLIALFTGARAEEIYSLSIDNIKDDQGAVLPKL